MAKAQTITTNFTAGVFAPRLRGRVDIEKYSSSLRDASNAVVLKQGGVTARPSLDYLTPISNEAYTAKLVPFVYSNTTSYMLEFGQNVLRVFRLGVLQTTLSTSYTAAMVDELDFTQSGDTMIIAHPSLPLQRLRRFSDTVWLMDAAPLNPGPIGETGHRGALTLTLSAASVGAGRTVTAASTFFRAGDVGRTLTSGTGVATITGFTSDTVVTAEITVAFGSTGLAANTWLLEGSPLTEITPDVEGPVGAAIELDGAVSTWRTEDIGRYVSINGGLVVIQAVAGAAAATDTHDGDGATTTFPYTFQILDATEITVTVGGVAQVYLTDYTLTNIGDPAGGDVVFAVAPVVGVGNVVFSRSTGLQHKALGRVVQELSAAVAAPSDSWVLKAPLWNAFDGYPATVTFYQQRLWAGNTARYPISKWGSRSGLYFDFLPGPNDDDAVYKTIDSKQATPIRFLHGAKSMLALTDGSEYDIRGGIEKPITQSNLTAARQTKWGCEPIKPEEVGDNILFVQRGGKVIRATYALDVEGYSARDISIYSDHLVRAGVGGLSFQQDPESICWCWTADGRFVAITYNAEQNVIALAGCSTPSGSVESICTVPEGDTDTTYMVVQRTVAGVAHRYIEKINWDAWPGLDSRVAVSGASATVWAGFSHLVGATVKVIADGICVGTKTVDGSGQITLDDAATSVSAGLGYVPSITLHDPEIGTGTGTAQTQNISTNKITVRLLGTIGCSVNGEALPWEQFDVDPLDNTMIEFNGDKDITDYGWTKDGGTAPLVISQPDPYPWTVLAVIREVTVNPG